MKSSPFTSLTFNDKRISARANLTLSKMIATGNSVIVTISACIKRRKLQAVSLMVRQAVSSILHLRLIRRPLLLMASLIYICGTVKREIPDAVSANTRNCRRS